MVEHDPLDLEWADVLPAAANEVTLAVEVVEVAIGVDPADVSRAEPSVRESGFGQVGALPIAHEHRARLVRAQPQFTSRIGFHIVLPIVDHAGVEIARESSDRAD